MFFVEKAACSLARPTTQRWFFCPASLNKLTSDAGYLIKRGKVLTSNLLAVYQFIITYTC